MKRNKNVKVVKLPKKKEQQAYDRTFFSCGCFGGGIRTTNTN